MHHGDKRADRVQADGVGGWHQRITLPGLFPRCARPFFNRGAHAIKQHPAAREQNEAALLLQHRQHPRDQILPLGVNDRIDLGAHIDPPPLNSQRPRDQP